MGAGAPTGIAEIADNFAFFDPLPPLDHVFSQMAIDCHKTMFVFDFDVTPKTSTISHPVNDPVGGGPYWSPVTADDIYPGVKGTLSGKRISPVTVV